MEELRVWFDGVDSGFVDGSAVFVEDARGCVFEVHVEEELREVVLVWFCGEGVGSFFVLDDGVAEEGVDFAAEGVGGASGCGASLREGLLSVGERFSEVSLEAVEALFLAIDALLLVEGVLRGFV